MKAKLFFFLSLACLPSLSALACPKGANDQQLTFDQVMLNFGHFLLSADSAVQTGFTDAAAISDAQIQDSLTGIAGALDCVDVVLANSSGQLYPPKYFTLQGADQEAYLKLFTSDMQGFRQGLVAFQGDFQALAASPAPKRDFSAAYSDSQSIDDLATKAHGDLQ